MEVAIIAWCSNRSAGVILGLLFRIAGNAYPPLFDDVKKMQNQYK